MKLINKKYKKILSIPSFHYFFDVLSCLFLVRSSYSTLVSKYRELEPLEQVLDEIEQIKKFIGHFNSFLKTKKEQLLSQEKQIQSLTKEALHFESLKENRAKTIEEKKS